MNKIRNIRYKKYYLYNMKKELLNEKQYIKENKYAKKLVLKMN